MTYDEHDNFRRIMTERADLVTDCQRLGGLILEPTRRIGFSGTPTRGRIAGEAGGSGFPIDPDPFGQWADGRKH
jgi:hypothetical protein